MLIVAYKHITLSNYINKTQTKHREIRRAVQIKFRDFFQKRLGLCQHRSSTRRERQITGARAESPGFCSNSRNRFIATNFEQNERARLFIVRLNKYRRRVTN